MQLNSHMTKTAHLISIFLILLLLTGVTARAVVAAPYLYFEPSTGNYSLGENFSITAKINSESETVGGADGVGVYDSTRLELVSITQAPNMVFSGNEGGGSCRVDPLEEGKFGFTCTSDFTFGDKPVNGNLVVFNFKAKAVGTAPVTFNCIEGSTTDSNIVKTSAAMDVISCGGNINGNYIIKEGTESPAPTSVPESSSTTTTTSTTTTAELPKTGVISTTIGLIVFGVISFVSAVFLGRL